MLRRDFARSSIFIAAFLMAICMPAVSQAGLVINIVESAGSGPAPPVAGGGNLEDILSAAAGFWEAAFPNVNFVLNLQFAWSNLGSALDGQFQNYSIVDGHVVSGTVAFNNQTSTVEWYADPNPSSIPNPAFGPLMPSTAEVNGSELNIGRLWPAGPSGPAAGEVDLMTVATHEIGHALGLVQELVPSNRDILVTPDVNQQFAGLIIVNTPMADHLQAIYSDGNYQGIGSTALMGTGFDWVDKTTRKGITAVDILAIAQINGWDNPNLDPYSVPEPSSIVMAATGVLAMWLVAGRSKGSSSS